MYRASRCRRRRIPALFERNLARFKPNDKPSPCSVFVVAATSRAGRTSARRPAADRHHLRRHRPDADRDRALRARSRRFGRGLRLCRRDPAGPRAQWPVPAAAERTHASGAPRGPMRSSPRGLAHRDRLHPVGRATAERPARASSSSSLPNVLNGQRLLSERLTVLAATARNGAHRISDRVYESDPRRAGRVLPRARLCRWTARRRASATRLIVADAGRRGRARDPRVAPAADVARLVAGRRVARLRPA